MSYPPLRICTEIIENLAAIKLPDDGTVDHYVIARADEACGHRHFTLTGAAKCLQRHRCRNQNTDDPWKIVPKAFWMTRS